MSGIQLFTKDEILQNLSRYETISLYQIKDINIKSRDILDYLDRTDLSIEEKLDFDKYYGKYLDDIFYGFSSDVNLKDFLFYARNKAYIGILYGNQPYLHDMPSEFKEEYSELFIDDDAPLELKDKFYNRNLTVSDIDKNPQYLRYLERVYFQLIKGTNFKNYKILNAFNSHKNSFTLREKLDFDRYFGDVLDMGDIDELFNPEFTISELYDYAMDRLYKKILAGGSYKEELPDHFKACHKELFLDDSAPYYLKELFYNRRVTFDYIKENPEYIVYLSGKFIKNTALYQNNSYTDVVSFASLYGSLIELVKPSVFYTSYTIHNEFLNILNGVDKYYIKKLSVDDFDRIAKSVSYVPKLISYTIRQDLDSKGQSAFYSSDVIMETAIDNGLDVGMLYTGSNNDVIRKILTKKIGSDSYSQIFGDMNNEKFIFDIYGVDDSIGFRKNLYSLFDIKFINSINIATDWDFYDILKVASDDRIKYLGHIINNNKLDEFYSDLSYLVNASYIKLSSLNDLLNMARFFVHYESLIEDIKKDEVLISDDNLSVIKSIYNMEEVVEGITSVRNLDDFSFKIKEDLVSCINDKKSTLLDIRNALSKYLVDMFILMLKIMIVLLQNYFYTLHRVFLWRIRLVFMIFLRDLLILKL